MSGDSLTPTRTGIREFIVNIIIKNSSDDEALHKQRTYLNKLNMVLVQILKQEWPHNWPDFIPSIVASSKANLSLCENNMAILKLLRCDLLESLSFWCRFLFLSHVPVQ